MTKMRDMFGEIILSTQDNFWLLTRPTLGLAGKLPTLHKPPAPLVVLRICFWLRLTTNAPFCSSLFLFTIISRQDCHFSPHMSGTQRL